MTGSLYNRPRVVWLILLLIMVAGYNAIQNMPRLEDPHMQSRVVQITTYYPGADAERVEAEVTEKLERKIQEIPEVKEINGISRSGVSFISVELEDRVNDAKPITARMRDKISEVTDLPAGTSQPDFSDTRIYAHSAILALTWQSETPINYAILGRHARDLASKLRNLPNTDFVDIMGLPQEEIRIELDDQILAAHGMTVREVAERVRLSDARGAAGVVSNNRDQMTIQVDGALDGLNRIRRIPIGFDEKGASLRLGDIATVRRAIEDPPSNIAYLDGHYGVTVSARMFENGRINDWSKLVGDVMAEQNKTLPEAVVLERIFDQNDYADERINGLLENMGQGALVVLVVLFISLGWRASLITASILPLALLSSLAITHLLGLRVQQVMVTGLIVALGIMVDNAIVITDEIQHRLLKGVRRSEAVAATISKMWLPLLGSSVTTIIAFMPLILMPGNAGDFLLGIPAAVIGSLISSYVIAFTIISALAGKVIEGQKPGEKERPRLWWRDGISGGALSAWFERSLRWSMRRPIRSAIMAAGIPLLGFASMAGLTEQFFPISDRDQFRLTITMPAQSSLIETKDMVENVADYIEEIDGIADQHWFVGTRPAKFYYSIIGSNDGVPNVAEAVIKVDQYELINSIIPKLQQELPMLLPEATVLVRELVTGPPFQAPLEVRILGPDLAVLEQLGEEVRSVMVGLPHVTTTNTSMKPGKPMVRVKAREADLSVLGLSYTSLGEQLQTLTKGVVATHMIEETEQVPVRMVLAGDKRSDLDSVANMNLSAGLKSQEVDRSYADVPLSAVADVSLMTKVGVITHFNGERMNNVQGHLAFGVLPEIGFNALKDALDQADIFIPPGYHLEFGGESEKRNDAMSQLFGTVGLLVLLMILAIVLTFNSFRMAFITFTAAFQAIGLGMLSLWVFDMPLSFVVVIGIMGLFGLAINAAIVILSELRGLPDARMGDSEAVVHGVMNTGRHILSTTLTTVGGFTPLILAGGYFWPAFAIAIAGGAFLSMIVSFYFAPAAFLALTRRRPVTAPA